MDIYEAIQHCREVAAGAAEQGKCPECAEDHRQLACWLGELVAYKAIFPEVPPSNKTLTAAELRHMVGAWVWVTVRHEHCTTSGWALVATGAQLGYLDQMLRIEDCGTKFDAWFFPPAGNAMTDEKDTSLRLHTIHEVKTLPEYFWPQVAGFKPFEVRLDDRGYQVGDILRQREWTPTGGYTWKVWDCEITYVLRDSEFVKEGYVVLGLKERSDGDG